MTKTNSRYSNKFSITCICYLCSAKKVPILIFTGDEDGTLTKWERMQSNAFMYRSIYL